jgi:hypothetical protein
MALKSTRVGDAVIDYADSKLTVRASFDCLEKIEQQFDKPAHEVINDAISKHNVTRLIRLLELLQQDSSYSADEIHDWLFGDLERANEENVAGKLVNALYQAMGVKIQPLLAKDDAAEKKVSKKKTD